MVYVFTCLCVRESTCRSMWLGSDDKAGCCWSALCGAGSSLQLGCVLGTQQQQQQHGKHECCSLYFRVVLLESLWNCLED